ncbi:MAG: TFIIB-type zinc ribbon-containing protein [Promethearchaeota archaeon]
MRCPKCGNDVRKEDYVCPFCNAILREDPIERIKIFKRVDEKWIEPDKISRRMINVIINPARAFWDMTHFRKKLGAWRVPVLTALAFGLMGLAVNAHVKVSNWYGMPITFANSYILFFNGLAIFLAFFLFGLIYFWLLYLVSLKLFSVGANYSVNLSKQIEVIYSEGKGKKKEEEEPAEEKTKIEEAESRSYLEEIPEYLTAEKSKKGSIMMFAFLPMVLVLLLNALLLLIALPTVSVSVGTGYAISTGLLNPIWNSPIWTITDWLTMITFVGWIPITMSIALREIANTSTQRLYISNLIIAIIIAVFLYFLRPTFLF